VGMCVRRFMRVRVCVCYQFPFVIIVPVSQTTTVQIPHVQEHLWQDELQSHLIVTNNHSNTNM